MADWITGGEIWATLVTSAVLEIVLGIDDVISRGPMLNQGVSLAGETVAERVARDRPR